MCKSYFLATRKKYIRFLKRKCKMLDLSPNKDGMLFSISQFEQICFFVLFCFPLKMLLFYELLSVLLPVGKLPPLQRNSRTKESVCAWNQWCLVLKVGKRFGNSLQDKKTTMMTVAMKLL